MIGASSAAYEFAVDGTMKITPHGHPPLTCSLHVFVRDCQWAVFRIWEGSTNRFVTEVSDDGDYVYLLDWIETNSARFRTGDYSGALPNSFVGQIHPAHFPFGLPQTEAVALFYAYASSCYLDTHTNGIIGPIPFSANDLPLSYEGAYARIVRETSPSHLPVEIAFLRSLEFGTNAILRTSDFTKVAGARVPRKVSLTRYSQDLTGELADYQFSATRVSRRCSLKVFTPRLPGTAVVTDYRGPHILRDDSRSLWPATNWPSFPPN